MLTLPNLDEHEISHHEILGKSNAKTYYLRYKNKVEEQMRYKKYLTGESTTLSVSVRNRSRQLPSLCVGPSGEISKVISSTP